MIAPFISNSITACDLPIAFACSSAFSQAGLLRHCNIGKTLRFLEIFWRADQSFFRLSSRREFLSSEPNNS